MPHDRPQAGHGGADGHAVEAVSRRSGCRAPATGRYLVEVLVTLWNRRTRRRPREHTDGDHPRAISSSMLAQGVEESVLSHGEGCGPGDCGGRRPTYLRP